jgi:hypothetical protein
MLTSYSTQAEKARWRLVDIRTNNSLASSSMPGGFACGGSIIFGGDFDLRSVSNEARNGFVGFCCMGALWGPCWLFTGEVVGELVRGLRKGLFELRLSERPGLFCCSGTMKSQCQ